MGHIAHDPMFLSSFIKLAYLFITRFVRDYTRRHLKGVHPTKWEVIYGLLKIKKK